MGASFCTLFLNVADCHFPLDSWLAWVVYGSACERRKGEGSISIPCMGASTFDVCKIFGLFDPPPLVTVTNQLILFLSSAFWVPPSPHPLWTSYMEAPYVCCL